MEKKWCGNGTFEDSHSDPKKGEKVSEDVLTNLQGRRSRAHHGTENQFVL